MDWVAAGLKRIIEFTQAGGEINVVVAGINVGAQPYWNAEATMLMHTKGILVMTPDSAMVLTGKQSLDFSGGVSAEDNFGIGGYDRVMGPNGQAQYWAPDLAGARDILLAHYDHAYVVPGEDGPRHSPTSDPDDRDVTAFPHVVEGSEFATVGDIFSARTNPDRKKPFDIRTVMRAVTDQDHEPLERWAGMADAETAVVWDARIGGNAVCLLGIESKSVPRKGFPPTDGPDTYTAGTLFPRSSKKAARAINAASGNRPLVVLANLSGFDGSPDSMRALQLEYGAEIGRAVVNFDGPIVFVVVSRYHGGAFVVFSKALNPRMTTLAVEGSFASVLGGAPAAAVVFARDVDASGDLVSFVACFRGPALEDEPQFEQALWNALQHLHDRDDEDWADGVAADPRNPHFAFSVAATAFFVVGLHPQASRIARRAPLPTLVFNLHEQFERMRADGKFERMRDTIRRRDTHLQGAPNPMAVDHGASSEARQYSGRAVPDDWEPPFTAEPEPDPTVRPDSTASADPATTPTDEEHE
jgi:FPC/CPF motif-containing protein YcgG